MFGSEVVAADTAQEAEPKSGCMSSLDKKGFMFCDDCHIAICNECCLACCRGEEILRSFCNVVFTHSYVLIFEVPKKKRICKCTNVLKRNRNTYQYIFF